MSRQDSAESEPAPQYDEKYWDEYFASNPRSRPVPTVEELVLDEIRPLRHGLHAEIWSRKPKAGADAHE